MSSTEDEGCSYIQTEGNKNDEPITLLENIEEQKKIEKSYSEKNQGNSNSSMQNEVLQEEKGGINLRKRKIKEIEEVEDEEVEDEEDEAGNDVLRMCDLIDLSCPKSDSKIDRSTGEHLEEVEEIVDEGTVIPVPRLKIGPNGEIVLDSDSLVIQRTDVAKAGKVISKFNTVQEDEYSYTRRRNNYSRPWNAEETYKFYILLNSIGTDFTQMAKFLVNRDRTSVKKKFKREEKHRPHLILKAMKWARGTFSLDNMQNELDLCSEDIERVREKQKQENKNRKKKEKKSKKSLNRKTVPTTTN